MKLGEPLIKKCRAALGIMLQVQLDLQCQIAGACSCHPFETGWWRFGRPGVLEEEGRKTQVERGGGTFWVSDVPGERRRSRRQIWQRPRRRWIWILMYQGSARLICLRRAHCGGGAGHKSRRGRVASVLHSAARVVGAEADPGRAGGRTEKCGRLLLCLCLLLPNSAADQQWCPAAVIEQAGLADGWSQRV
jgi:hypothetical protein